MSNLTIKSNPIFWIYTVSIVLFMAIPMWYLFQRNSSKTIKQTAATGDENIIISDDFKPDHIISLPKNSGKIAFRRRALTTQEYALLQKPESKKLIDNETWIGVLLVGDKVQLLDKEGWSYKIRFKRSSDNQIITGYIAESVDGLSSIKPIK